MTTSIEWPKKSGITIRTRLNGKDASQSYLVDIPDKVSGKGRVRKSFKEKNRAKAYAQSFWDDLGIAGRGLKDITEQELAEITLQMPRLRNAGLTLKQVVDYSIPKLRPRSGRKNLSEVIQQMLEMKKRDLECGDIKQTTYNSFFKRTDYLLKNLDVSAISDITKHSIVDFCRSLNSGNRNRLNNFNTLAEVMRFAQNEGYVESNPFNSISEIDKRACYGRNPKKVEEVHILSVQESKELLNDALEYSDLRLFPLYVLRLFCGIRSDEVPFLTWSDVKLDCEVPFVSVPEQVAKGRRIRNVDIPKNALAWLSLADKSIPLEVNKFDGDRSHEQAVRAFGLRTGRIERYEDKDGKTKTRSLWKRNEIRHTFASHHFAAYGDSIETARQMGHTEQAKDHILFTNYRSKVSKNVGEKFFKLVPKPSRSKTIQMPKTA